MNRRLRYLVFGLGAAGLAVLFALALAGLPGFGGDSHPYRDRAVRAALAHHTANVVSSINFDQRALDTFGEELILLGSVVGAAALLRPSRREGERPAPDPEARAVPDSVVLLCTVMLPVTVLVGLDVIAHGQLSPGGGFQGGVVLATGLHLLFLGGRYPALQRIRPLTGYQFAESVGVATFATLGLAGLAAGGAFLANVLPYGRFASLASAGTVPVLSLAVGVAVGGGVVVLLAQFLEQALRYSGEE
ncbi:MnhB domain-containing protein [Actinocatenispora sera]|uniref:Na+/H+ antiporter MnhB subunit-related protein domain-containing protein n=1 Tax=Actinocatenispora sera TaxID=390989 RepID=A0A810LBW5_9ACTN|nr:MnhB domain-containing protein [Actinocatenispora sera]BCJ31746.1 hypothetical protein Asera_58540 [Actinocatenispora sera]